MNSKLNRLAVVILNYNCSELSIHAAQNILQLNTGAVVILVDNCSEDDSKEKLMNWSSGKVQVYFIFCQKNYGYARGNNEGIIFAKQLDIGIDTILIMNPDIEVPLAEILTHMYETLYNNQDIGALTVKTMFNGTIRNPNECAWHFLSKKFMLFGGTIIGKKRIYPEYYEVFPINERGFSTVDVVQGCFFMIRLEVLINVDYLDPNTFLYSEESILAKKLFNKNYINAVLPNDHIKHNHNEKDKMLLSSKNKIFDMKCYYNSRKYYIEKYSNESKMFIHCAKVFLSLDLSIKKLVVRIKLRK